MPSNQQVSEDTDGIAVTVTGRALLGAMAIVALLLGGGSMLKGMKRDGEDEDEEEDEIDESDIESNFFSQ